MLEHGKRYTRTKQDTTQRDLTHFLQVLREQLPDLAARYHVTSLELFGSFVRNEQKPRSDLDILVTFSDPPSLLTFLKLEHELTDLLGVKVDLVMKDALKPRIAPHILAEAIPV